MSSPRWASTGSSSSTSHSDPDMINLYNNNEISDKSESSNGNNNSNNKNRNNIATGAAIGAGVVGGIIAGPFLGIAAAVGAGALAFQKNPAGDAARASGEVVCATGGKVKELNEQHQIVEKTKNTASVIGTKAQEFDNEHHVVDNTRNTLVSVGNSVRRFDQEHRVVEKTTKGLADGFHWLAKAIKGNGNNDK